MKRVFALFFLALLFCSGTRAAQPDPEGFVTGEDWAKNMSVREKYLSLVPPALLFSDYDVDLRMTLPQYIFLMDRVVQRNPQLEDEDVSNIFASTVYLFEPENRQALRTMEMNFLQGELENKPLHRPRLTIDDLLRERTDPEA